ncbi:MULTISPECIES: protease complex subunit PrcB family protein [unclassified Carboxylicivirga]|uniref:protease complex subunit PrcB family protein n=1 Tax=Carboxylicivirga TaxID=1628153 RepID=UPI003D32FC49
MKIIQKLVISTFLVISISTLMINDIEAQSFDYEIIGYGIDGKREENIEIIDNKNDFEKKWKRKISPDKLTTPIDFNKECIIAISRGQCGSGGHGIRIKDVYEESGYLIIEIVYTDPGENCRVTQALTYPYLVMRLKNRGLDIILAVVYNSVLIL